MLPDSRSLRERCGDVIANIYNNVGNAEWEDLAADAVLAVIRKEIEAQFEWVDVQMREQGFPEHQIGYVQGLLVRFLLVLESVEHANDSPGAGVDEP